MNEQVADYIIPWASLDLESDRTNQGSLIPQSDHPDEGPDNVVPIRGGQVA